ncbi:MAG: phytanoyl-CoA dioxygenase family protein, partial [Armatimonadetes bacterium]|nr:phytanoyl-CoA dioxygenase family protein [Armatimonadota bacterium]
SGAALRGALRRLMGDEPELFQDMALYKPPGVGREKPWHQDAAYFNLPDGVCVIGAWIALDDADVENGCMCVAPGSHRDGPALHFQRRDWQICDRDAPADRAVALPMASGDCLLFHGLLLHGTPPNHSLRRRRAVQFHYKPASAAWTEEAERLARFGGEGQGVEC